MGVGDVVKWFVLDDTTPGRAGCLWGAPVQRCKGGRSSMFCPPGCRWSRPGQRCWGSRWSVLGVDEDVVPAPEVFDVGVDVDPVVS